MNTSFNVRGEPIVNSPEDAFKCFMNTEMDVLVIENFIYLKKEQKIKIIKDEFKKIKNFIKLLLVNISIIYLLLLVTNLFIRENHLTEEN